uniref:Amidohydrolase-related domain-containing protein n=1 Tax=Ciona savignyi TaxID=51511 RepID=H2ZB28_CIOSA
MADTQYPFIKGVVGYVYLTSPEFEQHILRLKQNPKFVGIRKIWSEPDWIEREDVITGLEILGQYNLTFDLLIKSREQYNSVKRFLKRVPANLKIVLDHLGKPDAKSGAEQWWFDDITTIASYPNVYCKLSGMVTEADLTNWKASNFTQHVNHVMQEFGIDRVMFGSDWPVCKMACANLPEVYNLLDSILNKLTQNEKSKVFCENAIKFYNLKLD